MFLVGMCFCYEDGGGAAVLWWMSVSYELSWLCLCAACQLLLLVTWSKQPGSEDASSLYLTPLLHTQ